jgi:hypoxanthine phosphoribosyltransferase
MTELTFKDISKRLKDVNLPQFDMVIGIAEGGSVPASLTAYKLGCDLKIVHINYRDENNNPARPEPVLMSKNDLSEIKGSILLVDDVSISGKTIESAKKLLRGCEVKTMVMRGKADYVLFPEIESCVKWPWSKD